MAHELTSDNFTKTVQDNDVTLVDFWAPWCGPCKQMMPIVETLSEEMDSVTIGKVNVDENKDLAQEYGVMSIPTFIIFKDGEKVEQFSGSMSKEDLKGKLEAHV
jgi:thioredoxin 1